jgi:hypothetical protein
MNPIKIAYGFIDLLKPESEPLLALLLALDLLHETPAGFPGFEP